MFGTSHNPMTSQAVKQMIPSTPSYVLEILNHPFLLVMVLFTCFIAYHKVTRKLKSGELELSDFQVHLMAFVLILAIFGIARL